MPGPMGGGRGGGFSGGSRGGGFGGGSRGGFGGGPMHHGPHHHGPHHHHHYGPMFFGPRFHRPRYYGGGCIGGFAGAAFALIICAIFLIAFIASLFSGGMSSADPNSNIVYNEASFQAYANDAYDMAFSRTENYEENILIVFTVYEGYDGYECIPWGGYLVDDDVSDLFGSYFKNRVKNAIPSYYEFALTTSFRKVINEMTSSARPLVDAPESGLDTRFSVLYNRTSLDIDYDIVNAALQDFAKATGYNIAIVVDYGADVFGVQEGDKVMAIIGIVFIVIFAVAVIFSMKKKSTGTTENKGNSDKTDPNAGQGKYDPNTGTWK